MKNDLKIAIDGPVGSGKGTLALALARKLNASHIYTGGMYRALAFKCLNSNIDIDNENAVLNLLLKSEIELGVDGGTGLTHIYLDEKDVTHDIFLPNVSNITPIVSAHKRVREEMVRRQKEISIGKNVVMEGRDIASVVLPNADLKIFLTADVDERARRRFKQLEAKNVNISMDEVKQDIIKRDSFDSQREASPLEKSSDSFVVDTTNDTIDETVEKIFNELKRRNLI